MSDKTLEQLEAEAAEAHKTIEQLEAKKAELAEQKRKAERAAKELDEHKVNTVAKLEALELVGPQMMKLAGELKVKFPAMQWEVVSCWSEHQHGFENAATIKTAEKSHPECLTAKLGKRTITLTASPKVDKSPRWSSRARYEVIGTVQLLIKKNFFDRPIVRTYKSWDVADKMAKIMSECVLEEMNAANREEKRAEVLRTIELTAKKQFPTAEVVKASYIWVRDMSHSQGSRESNMVRLTVRDKKDKIKTERDYENVLAVNGTLTCTKVMRVPVA